MDWGDLMVIKIYRDIPSEERLSIRINNEVKILDNISQDVSFIINERKRYEIDIEQQISTSNVKPIFILLYLLTVIIQGVFNILLMNTDSKWYRNIKAYCLKAKLIIDMQQDTDVRLTYVNSKYDEKNKTWGLPIFTCEPNFVSNVSFILNPCDFKNQYFNYIKRVVSVAVIIILVFVILLYIAVVNSNNIAIIILSVLMLGIISLVMMLSFSEHKRLKNLYQSFLNQI